MKLDETFWSERYRQQQTGWDAGAVTTPIKTYIDQLSDKSLRILVPGCGYGHEVRYLHDTGFTQVQVIDISPEPLAALRPQCPSWPDTAFVHNDFFAHQGAYDLILEQTFFCALDPAQRPDYARKMHDLLVPGGKLVGVLFNVEFDKQGPPFGGTAAEYEEYFRDLFRFKIFEPCYNSIKPRAGNEMFIMLEKPGK